MKNQDYEKSGLHKNQILKYQYYRGLTQLDT